MHFLCGSGKPKDGAALPSKVLTTVSSAKEKPGCQDKHAHCKQIKLSRLTVSMQEETSRTFQDRKRSKPQAGRLGSKTESGFGTPEAEDVTSSLWASLHPPLPVQHLSALSPPLLPCSPLPLLDGLLYIHRT